MINQRWRNLCFFVSKTAVFLFAVVTYQDFLIIRDQFDLDRGYDDLIPDLLFSGRLHFISAYRAQAIFL